VNAGLWRSFAKHAAAARHQFGVRRFSARGAASPMPDPEILFSLARKDISTRLGQVGFLIQPVEFASRAL